MGPRLATLALLTTVGCSKLYDPDRLPAAADAPRPPPDVDACQMEVTELVTQNFDEGTGDGGGRAGVLVITGKNLVNQTTTVTFKPVENTTRTPKFEIDNAMLQVGSYGEQLAVPVKFPVDTMLPAGESIVFDVTVAQDCVEGQKTATILGKLTLRGLGELTGPAGQLQGGLREYSQIKLMGGAFTVAATEPIRLRSASSVEIDPALTINLNAAQRVGGPGGGTGGTGGTGLGGVGTPGTGPTPGITSGAPGGFSMTDPGLNTLSNPNRGSGGAGGDGAVLGNGGNGGGGGGSIEITALGNLKVGAINARGAAGAGGGGGAAGGGGSGGVILLRAGGTLTAGNLDVTSAGTGVRGRARYDAGGMATVPVGELGTDHLRGPQFVDLPFSSPQAKPVFRVSGKPLSAFKYFFTKQGGGVSSVTTALFDASGSARVTLSDPLEPGANLLCLITESGTPSSEMSNCAAIAYLP
jgi:hypothetical protein